MIQEFLNFLSNLDKGTVVFGSLHDVNIKLDRKQGPFLITYMVQNVDLDLRMNRYIPTYNFKMFICDRVPLNAKGEVVQETIDDMMALAIDILSAIKNTFNVLESNFRLSTSWGKFDCNVSGVSLEFSIKDRPVCIEQN